jgi:hypothetical protein
MPLLALHTISASRLSEVSEMANIARRALEELQALRSKRELTIGEFTVTLLNDDFALPVLRELENRYRREETGAGNDEAERFLKAVRGAAAEPEPDDIPSSSAAVAAGADAESPQWRLHRLAAHNYRGLTEWEGKHFEHDFAGKPCHIYGLNGSGKTGSLSAIVWCLTGACLRERLEPDDEIGGVDLYEDQACTKCLHFGWPEVVTVPHRLAPEDFAKLRPECWVEVELHTDNRRVLVRRTLPENSHTPDVEISDDSTEYGSLDQLGISDLDWETTLLMPARVSALQFEAGSKFSDNLLAVSGLDALRDIGALAQGLRKAVAGLRKRWQTEANSKVDKAAGAVADATSAESVDNETRDLLREVQETLPAEEDDTKPARFVRLYRARAEAIGKHADKQFLELVTAIASTPADAEKLKQLSAEERNKIAGALTKAKNFIEEPGARTWTPLAGWLAQDADVDSVVAKIEEWARNTREELARRYPLWLQNKEAQGKLAVKIRAAHYLHDVGDFEDCPVCDRELPKGIREEMERLASQTVADTDSLRSYLRKQAKALREAMPDAMRELEADAPERQLTSMFAERVTNHLNEFEPLQQEASAQWKTVAGAVPAWDWVEPATGFAEEDWDEEFTSELVDIEAQYPETLKLCDLSLWAQQHAESVATEVERAVAMVTDRLTKLDRYANRYGALRGLASDLDKAATECEEADAQLEDVAEADRVHGVLTELAALDKYAQLSLEAELAEVVDTMREFYGLLYPSDPIDFGGLTNKTTRKGVKADFRFVLKWSDDLFADAEPISNAGRMRGILWAYTFALIEAQEPSLQVIALHDPYTSLDDYVGQNMMLEVVAKRLGRRYQPLSTICEEHLLKPLWGRDPNQESFATLRAMKRGPNHRRCRVSDGGDRLRRALDEYETEPDKWEAVITATRVYLEDDLKLVAEYVLQVDHSGSSYGGLINVLADVGRGRGNPTELGQRVHGAICSLLKKLDVDMSKSKAETPNSSPILHELHHGASRTGQVSDAHADCLKRTYPEWAEAFRAVFDRIDFILSRADTVALANADSLPPMTEDDLPVKTIRLDNPIEMIGRVAAEGRVTLQDTDAEQPVEHDWPELGFALVAEDVCAPVALPGQTAIFAPDGAEVNNGDLAMIGTGDGWRLRRVFLVPLAEEGKRGWLGQSVNPLERHVEPVVVPVEGAVLRKLVGVLYSKEPLRGVPKDDELVPISSSPRPYVLQQLNGGKADLIGVSGDSAAPVALADQYLIVVRAELSAASEGSLCCVELSDGRTVLKRLTRSETDDTRLLLQPINPQAGYSIIEARSGAQPCDYEPNDEDLPHIKDIRVVRGVLFDKPEALGLSQ